MMCGPPKRGKDSEETGTESEMTEGTEETITDPEELQSVHGEEFQESREFRKRTTPSIHSVECGVGIRT